MIQEEQNHLPRKIWIKLNYQPNQNQPDEDNALLQSIASMIEERIWKWDIQDNAYAFNLPDTIFVQPSKLGYNYYANQDILYFDVDDMHRKSLSQENLATIWSNGTFSIKSKVEDLPYVWALSSWIIKGHNNIKSSLSDDISKSFYFIYTIKNRFTCYNKTDYVMSFPSSFYSMYRFLWHTTDLLVGLPLFDDKSYEINQKVKKKNLIKFLDDNPKFNLRLFCEFIRRQLREIDTEFQERWKSQNLKKEKEYTAKRMSISEKLNKLAEDKNEFYMSFLENNEKFISLNSVYSCLSFILAGRIIKAIKMEKHEEVKQLTKTHDVLLQQSYIRYRVKQWKEDKMREYTKNMKADLKEKYHQEIDQKIEEYELPSLFYKNYLENKRNEKADFEKEEAITPKSPHSLCLIERNCIRPYEIYQTQGYIDEVSYLRKSVLITVSSKFIFWRTWLYLLKFFIYTFNAALGIFRWGMYSSIGFLALFCYDLYSDETLVHGNQIILTDNSYTYPRSLCNLLTWISESRREFEQMPDSGFFGKSISRIFNLFYNYVIKLIILGTLLFTIYPCLILANTALCMILYFLSPVIALIMIIGEYLINIIIYDWKFRGALLFPIISYTVWYLIIKGLIQLALTLIYLILQPLLSVFMIFFGCLRYCLRLSYDFVMYGIVKCLGKIPVTDSGFAWKVAGPGIAHNRYAQISNEELIKFIHATLERLKLNDYANHMRALLNEPSNNVQELNKFFSQVQMNYYSSGFISESISHFNSKLSKVLDERRELYPCLGDYKVKYSQTDLELVKNITSKYLQESFLKENYSFMWNLYTLEEDSYEQLAEEILKVTFGGQVLESLEENDQLIRIESKTNSNIDLIAKKILEDPYFSNKQVVEKRDDEQIIYKAPPAFVNFSNTLDSYPPFRLDFHLLTTEERKNYYGEAELF